MLNELEQTIVYAGRTPEGMQVKNLASRYRVTPAWILQLMRQVESKTGYRWCRFGVGVTDVSYRLFRKEDIEMLEIVNTGNSIHG